MTNFKSLLENYKIIFFDAYGVIKTYKGLIPGIEKTFDWLNEQQKPFYIITNDITALVLLDDEGFEWMDGLNKAVNLLRRRTIPAIIANPDGAYPMSKKDVGIAIGGLAYMIEKITGRKFIRFGKPDS